MIELSVVIVTYNSEKQIGLLLDSIYKDRGNIDLEVIVLDNNSADASLLVVRNHKTKPLCIQMGSNTGFSIAVNQGLKKAKGNYLLLLNPDTVVQKGTLKKLLDFAKNTSPFGAVSPRLLNPDGKPQASVYKFPTITNAIMKNFFNCQNCFGKYLPDNRVQKVDVATMAAFLIPRTTFKMVGGLDEKYFMYYEDVDYCRRLHESKLPVYYLPSAKIKHVHGASGRFSSHYQSPLLASSRLYYGEFYSNVLNLVLWIGHKWQVILRGHKFRD
ncbi:MAG: Glycosyltransferase/rhamnosyltransferase [Candidatus Nomurabacteria bacterium GW2011_GWC2_41_8]|uniref:Glycosyltransferase/rhamnosyltransferase n=1 Tax=Candidatus Nomurabacteria bacterium GW2011_GWC2_41_8 TaxID=1618755 RepID=A0A0G0XEZ9_9BACT|nr:MAG: Glycosyltransferase/rhamnosyltransferase [Candidatus Nomurabacteria bacterium GW2011_GWC2_41_8]